MSYTYAHAPAVSRILHKRGFWTGYFLQQAGDSVIVNFKDRKDWQGNPTINELVSMSAALQRKGYQTTIYSQRRNHTEYLEVTKVVA